MSHAYICDIDCCSTISKAFDILRLYDILYSHFYLELSTHTVHKRLENNIGNYIFLNPIILSLLLATESILNIENFVHRKLRIIYD